MNSASSSSNAAAAARVKIAPGAMTFARPPAADFVVDDRAEADRLTSCE
jgi:hypothetical protein